jgi:hypothetical protein
MREYKLYKLALYKTKNGLMGVQNYVSDVSLSERHYDEEVDTGRTTRANKPIYSGKIFFETEDLPSDFVDNPERNFNVRYFYDLVIEEDDKAKKSIKECTLVRETTDIIFGQVSAVRRTKPKDGNDTTRPYVFFSYSIDTSVLDSASNKDEFIAFMAGRGLRLGDSTYQDKYQFSGFYTLFENQIPMFSPLAYKYQHYLITIQEKNGNFYINNINPSGVFSENPVLLRGNVTAIIENGDKKVVTVEKSASYDELRDENATLLPYMAKAVEVLEEGVKKMTFDVITKNNTVSVGDEVSIELNEDNFTKIQNPKITIDTLSIDNLATSKEDNTTKPAEKQPETPIVEAKKEEVVETPVVEAKKEEVVETPAVEAKEEAIEDNVDFDGSAIKEDVKKEDIPF